MAVSCYLQPRAMNGIKTLPSVTKSWLAERGGGVQTKPSHNNVARVVARPVSPNIPTFTVPASPSTASMHPTAPAVRSAARCRRRG